MGDSYPSSRGFVRHSLAADLSDTPYDTLITLEEDGTPRTITAEELLREVKRVTRAEPETVRITSKMADPRGLLLQTAETMRRYLSMSVQMMERLYEVQEIEQFQKDVLTAVEEAAPDVADRIRRSLYQRHALRTVLEPPEPLSP